jgi:hypothetical protein
MHLDITVTFVVGQYRTSCVDGLCGVARSSPARAAERLAEKLWGITDLDTARRIDTPNPAQPGVSRWRITDTAARKNKGVC